MATPGGGGFAEAAVDADCTADYLIVSFLSTFILSSLPLYGGGLTVYHSLFFQLGLFIQSSLLLCHRLSLVADIVSIG